ncbi:DUF3578 domain-containing protein [Endozoicomonas sp. OPT23]|uniref:MrcB family domain-containing protein n=1 Tax=Endozoicomonas sp. OPT23 TaxID=2072845 RepID=UPI00129BBFF6|nr:DUF3578 domain-containing protein [Endozoicomonas sp. OPT23]MRI32705.1 DUF3578 domain-containing protein [Endozoicomonas sp. OPT23]
MLREVLQGILDGWLEATNQSFSGHPMGSLVRQRFADSVKEIISTDYSSFKIKGSAGAGGWANVPWLSITNPLITTSTQDGVYPVYLFKADGSGVYLSFNQGTTKPQEKLGAVKARARADRISRDIQTLLPDLAVWGEPTIGLNSTTSLGRSYEYGNIIARYYPANDLPSDQQLEQDLLELMAFYKDVEPAWKELSIYEELPVYEESSVDKEFAVKPMPEEVTSTLDAVQLPKPFMLLAGISGTGKTRFVRQQASQHSSDLSNYCLVPVRPDWHEPSDLLGYISRLGKQGLRFIVSDLLRFIVKAWREAARDVSSDRINLKPLNQIKPYWLCLDEMNLAPVEQYFADYLSVLETREWKGECYDCDPLLKPIVFEELDENGRQALRQSLGLNEADSELWNFFCQQGIAIPPNMLVAGTVNMDETTHGFSRKVIDRAFTVDFGEFYPNDFQQYFSPVSCAKTLTFSQQSSLIQEQLSAVKADTDGSRSILFLEAINKVLKSTPYELAYRALNELLLSLLCFSPANDIELQSVWDDFLMTKILPRIEGDADKLLDTGDSSLLTMLQNVLCEQLGDIWDTTRPDLLRESINSDEDLWVSCRSQKKLSWMIRQLETNGFTAFWP